MPNLIGQSLGRYHILEQLGEGGMAVVYKAYDTRLERNVAIKVILPGKEHSEKFIKRFEREAKALAGLSHPNIVGVIDYGEYEGLPYLVMEYIPSGTLKQKLTGKPMPWREAAKILLPIARALAYAHNQKIIHRDVKPSNILITQSGEPMLSDFGIAKMLEAEETLDLTGTGVGVGTPEYMSPEQAQGKPVDARSDIYSLGVVFYEMVTGRKPYQADTPMAVIYKLASEPLPRPKEFQPNLPSDVEQSLLKALSKQPANRYTSIDQFADDLDNISHRKKQEGVKQISQPFRRKVAISLIVMLATGFVIWGLLRGTHRYNPLTSLTSPTIASMGPLSQIPQPSKTALASPTAIESLFQTPLHDAQEWTLGNLIYEQTFENDTLGGFLPISGTSAIIQTSDGNHVWQTSEDADSQLTLPTQSNDYAVEAKVMQVSGNGGFGMIHIRREYGSPCTPDYELYMDALGGWLNFIERSNQCDELRQTGLFDNYHTTLSIGTWYTFKVEAKGPAIKVYLNNNLVMYAIEPGRVLKSNIIGFSSCCNDTLPHTFDFDDIRVWLINP